MKVLTSHVLSAARSGVYQYAKVESVDGGRATVRLGATGKGSRITNLFVAGSIAVGGLVVVDYSADTPYIRSAQPIAPRAEPLRPVQMPLENTD
jgi:hypothetical protein